MILANQIQKPLFYQNRAGSRLVLLPEKERMSSHEDLTSPLLEEIWILRPTSGF